MKDLKTIKCNELLEAASPVTGANAVPVNYRDKITLKLENLKRTDTFQVITKQRVAG